jgi:hypothetical protein
MKQIVLMLLSLGIVLTLCLPAGADTEMPRSVIGNGGGGMSGDSNVVSGSTLGQAAIGFVAGPSNVHQIGFWYGGELLSPAAEEEASRIREYELCQNYPNPFNPVTTLEFAVPIRSRVTIRLYDVTGREVMELVDEHLDPGVHRAVMDAAGLSSGVYFYRMTAGAFVESKKLVLLK